MPSLLEIQNTFFSALLSAKTTSLPTEVLSLIRPNSRISPFTQFTVYQNSITGNLMKALKNIYPVCCRLVGEEFFYAMAAEYISQYPSTTRDLNQYGKNLPDFIENFPPASELAYLAGIAKLELAWHEIYSAAPTTPFDFQKFAERSADAPEQIFFSLPNQSTLLTSSYPLKQIWEANRDPMITETEIVLTSGITYAWLIWRKHFEMRIDPLTHLQWSLLNWIQLLLPLPVLCDKLSSAFPTANAEFVLPELINLGWIANFDSLKPILYPSHIVP